MRGQHMFDIGGIPHMFCVLYTVCMLSIPDTYRESRGHSSLCRGLLVQSSDVIQCSDVIVPFLCL